MQSPLETLRKLIDEQNADELGRFIGENQSIDYDNISPNGASALWWALMPPAGTTVSQAIVACLLDYRKHDGSYLVNPVQTFPGLTPQHYLRGNDCRSDLYYVRGIIEDAENHYERPQSAVDTVRDLAAIAEDRQNAHDSTVGALTRGNIIRLHQHYVKGDSNSLNEKAVETAGNEIEAFLGGLRKEQRVDAEQVRYGLDFCCRNPDPFAFKPLEENSEAFSLTLAQLLTLNWMAAKEQDADLLPAGATDDEALNSRKKAILNILYDIATAYGKNSASCAGGACNRLGMALASQHKLVDACLKEEKITGEMAVLIALRILGEALARLSEDNKEAYWTVIRNMATLAEAEEKSYQEVISAYQGPLLAQMLKEDIDEKFAGHFIEALNDDYPLSGHKTSYQLAKLMSIMHKQGLDLAPFDGSTPIDEAVNQAVDILAKEKLQNSTSFVSLKSTFGVSGDNNDTALEKQFILHSLEQARRRQIPDDLHPFINAPKPSKFAEDCFLLSFFSSNKEKLKQENPAQAMWLDNLSNEQMIDLMSAVQPYCSDVGRPTGPYRNR